MKHNTVEEEAMFAKMMAVFREYEVDLNIDIEGCDAEELREIENCRTAAIELRKRIVRHICEGANARGRNDEKL